MCCKKYGMRTIVFLGLLWVLPVSIWGQGSEGKAKSVAVTEKTDKYAAESVVHEHASTVYSFAADGTGYRESRWRVASSPTRRPGSLAW
jgi:hypothetical protein